MKKRLRQKECRLFQDNMITDKKDPTVNSENVQWNNIVHYTQQISLSHRPGSQWILRTLMGVTGCHIYTPMGSLSFLRSEIRLERERERRSVVVPEWAVVHSDVSCSDWLLVSLAALCDLNIFLQKSFLPKRAPGICSSLAHIHIAIGANQVNQHGSQRHPSGSSKLANI